MGFVIYVPIILHLASWRNTKTRTKQTTGDPKKKKKNEYVAAAHTKFRDNMVTTSEVFK